MTDSSSVYYRIPIIVGAIVIVLVVAVVLIFQQTESSSDIQTQPQLDGVLPADTGTHTAASGDGGKTHNKTSRGKSDEAEGAEKDKWSPPRFDERREERHRMVSQQITGRGVEDDRVLAAMKHVPRHKFVPPEHTASAYEDHPLPIGQGQTISQPYIVGFMTELLKIDEDDRVLEIGTGSGYQAAVLSELTPNVYTIEIIEELSTKARKRLNTLGYDTVKVKTGDGYFGWKQHAPFDGIIVTAAAGHIPSPLLKQLKKGGRMIIPVGGAYETQYLVLVRKSKDGTVNSEQLMPVRFVPMTGRAQEAQ